MNKDTPENWPTPKTADEIQRAHDLLVALLLNEVPLEIDKGNREILNICASVLCWTLGHDHNEQFRKMLEHLEKAVMEAGYVTERRNN